MIIGGAIRDVYLNDLSGLSGCRAIEPTASVVDFWGAEAGFLFP